MEITLDIKPNAYKKPSEIRPDVVKLICIALMNARDSYSAYHPFTEGYYRLADEYISKDGKFLNHKDVKKSESYTITSIEMDAAFKAIIKLGYHIFSIRCFDSWKGYVVSSRDYRDGGSAVSSFSDQID